MRVIPIGYRTEAIKLPNPARLGSPLPYLEILSQDKGAPKISAKFKDHNKLKDNVTDVVPFPGPD